MRRYAYIGACILFLLVTLTACGERPEARDSVPVPTPDSVAVPDTVEAPETVPNAAEVPEPDSVAVSAPDSGETPDSVTTSDSGETLDSVTTPDSGETPDSVTTPEPEARDLTDVELQKWSKFLRKADCNGFLMSSYDTPLDADLIFVFYSGAGVGQYPTDEMTREFLDANGLEEVYTDIVFIPYDEASKILERRTGYTLEHFKLAGNDIPMYYSEKYAGYFQMAGDTNYMPVECVSGRLNADGSIFLEVRESSDWGGDLACSFETTLKPDFNGKPGNMVFDRNVITGGWLTWQESEEED